MTAVTRISVDCAKAALDARTALLNGGTIKLYTGSQPATVAAAPTGTLLATLTLSNPAFAAAVAGGPGATAAANAITGANAVASANAGWFRAYSSGAVGVIQGNVGERSADLIMQSIACVNGQPVAATGWTLRESIG